MWGADWKFRHRANCSASRGLPSDAEQLPEWWNFQSAPKNHYGFFFLHTLPSTYSRQIFNYLDPILIYISLRIDCLFEIRKIAVCFLWLSLPGHYRVTDEALLAETTSYDPSSFLWMFSLLLKELIFYFYFPSTIAFRLEYVFYQFHAKITRFFDQE